MSSVEVLSVDELILDAAEDLFATEGVPRTTVEQIAVAAGVSRVTVYRRIGNRDTLLLSVLMRSTTRFLARLSPRLIAQPNVRDALALLVRATVRGARRDDLSVLFGSEEQRATGAPIPGSLVPLSEAFGAVIAELAERFPGQLSEGLTASEAGEWTLRAVLSFITIDTTPPRPTSEIDTLIRRFVLPGLLA